MCGRRARADSRCVDVVFVLDAARSGIRWANPTYVFTHIELEVYFNVGEGGGEQAGRSCYWKPSNRHEKLKWFRQSRQKYGKRTATIPYIKYCWKN